MNTETIPTTTTSTGTSSTGSTGSTGSTEDQSGGTPGTGRAATNDARRPPRRGRRLAAVLLATAVAAGAGLAVSGPSSGSGPSSSAGRPDSSIPSGNGAGSDAGAGGELGGEGLGEAEGDLAAEPAGGASLPEAHESGDEGGEGDSGEGEGGESEGGDQPAPQPQPEPEPDAEPEDQPEPPVVPAQLDVPSELKLKAGVYTGSFKVANTGGAPLTWKAWPDAGVSVDVEEGSLEGGEEVTVTFTIDASELESGSFKRRIMVDAPDVGAKDLWVSGSKPIDKIVWCKPGTC